MHIGLRGRLRGRLPAVNEKVCTKVPLTRISSRNFKQWKTTSFTIAAAEGSSCRDFGPKEMELQLKVQWEASFVGAKHKNCPTIFLKCGLSKMQFATAATARMLPNSKIVV